MSDHDSILIGIDDLDFPRQAAAVEEDSDEECAVEIASDILRTTLIRCAMKLNDGMGGNPH
jgi:hypothetical protein